MIDTYSAYIRDYIAGYLTSGKPVPGEHHFASIYLAPKIFKIKEMIPEYINPDGTKDVIGDLFYKEKDVSIEIKYMKIKFTEKQINNWIKGNDKTIHPKYIIGINENRLFLQNFEEFRKNYICILEDILKKQKKIVSNIEEYTCKDYSPQINVDKYVKDCKNKLTNTTLEAFKRDDGREKIFEKAIRDIFE